MNRRPTLFAVLALLVLLTPVTAATLAAETGQGEMSTCTGGVTQPVETEPHPYPDCEAEPNLADCSYCCAGEAAAVKNACLTGGLSQYFCEQMGERTFNDCLTRACGVKGTGMSEQMTQSLADVLLAAGEGRLEELGSRATAEAID